uniref:G-protein coupled receptors family 1 profile domain-containing protein n=1 Tax=Nothobranchius furzeri TaxID=105023 RepID=A0A8C6M2T1_NOTFU
KLNLLLLLVVLCGFSTVPACVFLCINGTMLFTLRSKPVFRDTCRYILLYNLLLADTAHLVVSQLLFLLAVCRVRLTYPACGTISTIANLTGGISPLTLVVMSLERYVAVCFPLRHASIITTRNTAVAIIASWAISSINNLTRDYCYDITWFPSTQRDNYDKAYTCLVFVSAGLAVIYSYTGVVVAARSASTDKASAHKARKTLLLHLIQLGLSLSSMIYHTLLIALARTVSRLVFVWVQDVFYVFFVILPRCLSSLLYGLRDQTIRPVLLHYLCCHLRFPVEPGLG